VPRGLRFSQVGVTEAMIATYADAIWKMSNNLQVRRGDPVRKLEFGRIEAERADLGMSDAQIAQAIGLTRDQVLLIRLLTEVRRFRRRSYQRLYELGRGHRFNPQRYLPHEARGGYSAQALALRAALRFDPEAVGRFIAGGFWAHDTLTRWLARHAADTPVRAALRGPEAQLGYEALRARSESFAAGLSALGLGRGDVVSVQLPNSAEFLIAYLAIARLGAVMSTIHMPYRSAELKMLLGHSQARALICLSSAKDFAPAAAALGLKPQLAALEHVIALGTRVDGAASYAELLESGGEVASDSAPAPADPFLLLFTSGTTSSPKAVPLTYQATLGNARLFAAEMRLCASDVVLCAAPFTHLLGLFSLHLALCVGASSVVHVASGPAELVAAIESHRPSVLFAAPAHLAAMATVGLLQAADFSSLRRVVVSGSAVPPELARLVAAKLPPGAFTQLWGMTELQAGMYTRPDDPLETTVSSTGRPGPGTDVRTCDVADVPVAAGEEGELQVRGALLFPGYFMNEAANRGAFTRDGWFRTGDLAVIDARGCVRITGRVSEFINRGGVKYHPGDVEDLLATHPKIAQVAIVPCPDPILGERACCFVVPQGAQGPTLEEICCFLLERGIAKLKLPERLELIDEMPMTPTRKIIKGKLRERLARS
jgi:non-ribosomal peptide synthetase component E (peptide arylation enzyme)